MIEFEDALKAVLENSRELSPEKVSLDDSIGMILAEDIRSKIEMPPFNKSAMDGYAVRAEDARDVPARLKCIGFIQAGEVFTRKPAPGECVKIMTGAGLPEGTDAVVMVEDTRMSGDYVEIAKPAEKGKNVCLRGEDIKRKEKVLERGREISISDIALLASVGRRFVKAIRKPAVCVLSTGGEIVPAGRKLGQGKIYNSNGPQLLALLKADRIAARYLGIAKDRPCELRRAFRKGLAADILLVSGGVSVGDYDLVPKILTELGVKKVFHNVKTKPGKPLFFGRRGKTVVFGIPGNPVSNFVAYSIYVQPAIYKMTGKKEALPVFEEGILESDFRHKAGRKHFVPATISEKGRNFFINPVDNHGSADILALSKADGFMVADADVRELKAMSKVKFITWKREKFSP